MSSPMRGILGGLVVALVAAAPASAQTVSIYPSPGTISASPPPLVPVDPGRKPTAPGLVFLSAKSKKDQKQNGPMIVDNAGKLVWFRPLSGIGAATDFRAQTYQGKPVLTYWEGTSRQGIGTG